MTSRAGRALTAVKSAIGVVRQRIPKDSLSKAVTRYEAFTGVHEVRLLQKNVIAAQEKFIKAQEMRRKAGDNLINSQSRLKTIHDEMQTISKGDPNYLKLITEEHKIIIEEESLRTEFQNIEKVEREFFTEMTAAVKLSQETERVYAEKNKYLYLLASIAGTALGFLGSTINNKIKMNQFKDMMTEERSGSKLWNLNFSEGSTQEKLKSLESRVIAISTNQQTIFDYIIKIEKMVESEFQKTNHMIHTHENKERFSVGNVAPLIDDEKLQSICFYSILGLVTIFIVGKCM